MSDLLKQDKTVTLPFNNKFIEVKCTLNSNALKQKKDRNRYFFQN